MDSPFPQQRRLREGGSVANPPNRFELIAIIEDPEFAEWQAHEAARVEAFTRLCRPEEP